MQNELELDGSPSRHATTFQKIKGGLRRLYLQDPRPWLVGFSGGKDSTLLASLIIQVAETRESV